jgi:hypothetical protein
MYVCIWIHRHHVHNTHKITNPLKNIKRTKKVLAALKRNDTRDAASKGEMEVEEETCLHVLAALKRDDVRDAPLSVYASNESQKVTAWEKGKGGEDAEEKEEKEASARGGEGGVRHTCGEEGSKGEMEVEEETCLHAMPCAQDSQESGETSRAASEDEVEEETCLEVEVETCLQAVPRAQESAQTSGTASCVSSSAKTSSRPFAAGTCITGRRACPGLSPTSSTRLAAMRASLKRPGARGKEVSAGRAAAAEVEGRAEEQRQEKEAGEEVQTVSKDEPVVGDTASGGGRGGGGGERGEEAESFQVRHTPWHGVWRDSRLAASSPLSPPPPPVSSTISPTPPPLLCSADNTRAFPPSLPPSLSSLAQQLSSQWKEAVELLAEAEDEDAEPVYRLHGDGGEGGKGGKGGASLVVRLALAPSTAAALPSPSTCPSPSGEGHVCGDAESEEDEDDAMLCGGQTGGGDRYSPLNYTELKSLHATN